MIAGIFYNDNECVYWFNENTSITVSLGMLVHYLISYTKEREE